MRGLVPCVRRFSSVRPQCPHPRRRCLCLWQTVAGRLAGESGPRSLVPVHRRSAARVPFVRFGPPVAVAAVGLWEPIPFGPTEPVLSGRWCLTPRCSGWRCQYHTACGGKLQDVCSTVGARGHAVGDPGHVCQGARPWGQGASTVGASRHIQLSVVCAWLAAVYIHAPGVPAGCMPPAPGYCHEGLGGTAPAFGESAAVMGMPTAPNDEEGV